MYLSGSCRCVGLASMLRQACGQGQKVDLAAQKGTLLGQQEACQESFFLGGLLYAILIFFERGWFLCGVIMCYPYILLRGGVFERGVFL